MRVLHVDDDIMDHRHVARCIARAPSPCILRHRPGLTGPQDDIHAESADVILLDLCFGGYRGLEALQAAVAMQVQAPIVVLTSDADPQLGIRAIQAGAEDFLSKANLDAFSLWKALTHSRTRWLERQRSQAPDATPLSASRTTFDLQPGERLDRYVVEQVIGAGGMATVYRVRHRSLGSLHALKVMQPRHGATHSRLDLEGKLQAQLRHRNLVAVTDVMDLGLRGIGLVMEYVPGPTLDQWIAQRPTNAPEAWLPLFLGIVRGVRRAHQASLVHRDLKPTNVLLMDSDDGLVPKVTDFGVAKILDASAMEASHHTQAGVSLGTPGFMAPEQIDDAASVDHRADMFSLGCILYQLACGRRPFEGKGQMAVLLATAGGAYPAPTELVPDLSETVARAISWLLATKVEDRLPDCQTLLELLDQSTGR